MEKIVPYEEFARRRGICLVIPEPTRLVPSAEFIAEFGEPTGVRNADIGCNLDEPVDNGLVFWRRLWYSIINRKALTQETNHGHDNTQGGS